MVASGPVARGYGGQSPLLDLFQPASNVFLVFFLKIKYTNQIRCLVLTHQNIFTRIELTNIYTTRI